MKRFIKVRGQLMYLYRAVDGLGNTVECFLSRTRGIAAAKAFFRKALKHHQEPHSITLDGHRPSHSALRRMGMNGSSIAYKPLTRGWVLFTLSKRFGGRTPYEALRYRLQ